MNDLLFVMIKAAKKAGVEIVNIYNSTIEVDYKKDKSPLTNADLAAHTIICELLSESFPNIPLYSEEDTSVCSLTRMKWSRYFLIDPLDGTKEFINRNDEFTVNIALIEDGVPVLGVVYAPIFKKLYSGGVNTPATLEINGTFRELPFQSFDPASLNVVASKSHLNDETKSFVDSLRLKHSNINFKSAGSSLKLCMVAEGTADIYPRIALTSEWDTAAAHAVVNASGGNVFQFNTNREVIYNKEDILNPFFIVCRKEMKI